MQSDDISNCTQEKTGRCIYLLLGSTWVGIDTGVWARTLLDSIGPVPLEASRHDLLWRALVARKSRYVGPQVLYLRYRSLFCQKQSHKQSVRGWRDYLEFSPSYGSLSHAGAEAGESDAVR